MQTWKTGLLASIALTCVGVVDQANAQAIYGAGASFPSIAYRKMFDCLYLPADRPTPPGQLTISSNCPSSGGDASGYGALAAAQILYAPTGSGNGKAVFKANNPSLVSAPPSNYPYLSSNTPSWPYPFIHFAGSDDVWTSQDVADYAAAGGPGKYGNVLALPTLAGNVAIAFNNKDGNGGNLNIVNSVPNGGSSGLNLSRKALCGIFSGHITKWNNPILNALNGNTALGTGTISVAHRSDGSGTNFLLTNALAAQCAEEFGPNNETDGTLTLYKFPWTDNGAPTSQCPALPARGANKVNWPDSPTTTDQCNTVVANPGGGTFIKPSGSGNSALVSLINSTNGAIGYTTTDFVQPFVPTGPRAANVQNQYDIDNVTGRFQPPTAQGAQIAMSSLTPVFDANTRKNPLNWSRQGVNPNPVLDNAYPLSGFTWLFLYQCYSRHSGDPVPFINFAFNYIHGNASPILNEYGFASVPYPWLIQVSQLMNDPTASPLYIDQGACAAAGVTPGAAH